MNFKFIILLSWLFSCSYCQTVRNVTATGQFNYCTGGTAQYTNRCSTNFVHASFVDALLCATKVDTGSVIIYLPSGLLTESCLSAVCSSCVGAGCTGATTACFCSDTTCNLAATGTCTSNTFYAEPVYATATSPTISIISAGTTSIDFSLCSAINPLITFTGSSTNLIIQGVIFESYVNAIRPANCAGYTTEGQCLAAGCAFRAGACNNPAAGNEDGGILSVAGGQVTLTNVFGNQNSAYQYGGFAYLTTGTTLSVTGGGFSSNSAETGGAFYIDGGMGGSVAQFINTSFTENTGCAAINCYGGAMFIDTNVDITLDTVSFVSNSAGYGGALYVSQNSGNLVYLTSSYGLTSDFYGNIATNGGAIWFYGEILNINHCNISQNKATIGAGLYVQDISIFGSDPIDIISSYFYSNIAAGDNTLRGGGAIFTSRKLTVSQSTFVTNKVTSGNGGAIYIVEGDVELATCIFSGNSGMNGGAVYSSGSGSINDLLSGLQSSFTDNTASGFGGAVFISTQEWEFSTCTFVSNTATTGGAVYSGSLTGTINEGTSFSSNKAQSGGAVYTSGNLDVDGSKGQVFMKSNNATSGYGGAINCFSDPATSIDFILTVAYTFLSGNSAIEGGAIYSTCTTLFSTDIFISNIATLTGAAFYCNSSAKVTGVPCQITVSGCTFQNGTSPGAGSFAADGNYQISTSTFSLGSSLIIPPTQTGLGITTTITSCTFTSGSNVSANATTIITDSSFTNSSIFAIGSLTVEDTQFFSSAVCDCLPGCTATIDLSSSFSSSTLINYGTTAVEGVAFSTSSALINTASGILTTDTATTFASSNFSNSNSALNSAVISGTATGSVFTNPTGASTTLVGFSFTSSSIINLGTFFINETNDAQCISLDSSTFVNNGSVYLASNCDVNSNSAATSDWYNNGQLYLNGVSGWIPDFICTNISTINVQIISSSVYDSINFQESPSLGGGTLVVNWLSSDPLPTSSQQYKIFSWTTGPAITSSSELQVIYNPPNISTGVKIAYDSQYVAIAASSSGKVIVTLLSFIVAVVYWVCL